MGMHRRLGVLKLIGICFPVSVWSTTIISPHSRTASRNDDSPNKMILSKQELLIPTPEQGKVIEIAQVGGLHHHYLRQAT